MRNFRIDLTYDGSRYKGWQRLGGGENTIQAKLESVLGRMLNCPVEVIGSGRTDAGVHAIGQVANFHAKTQMTAAQIQRYLRKHLPEDIGVLSVTETEERFHSRLSAVEKTYRYCIWNSDEPCVFHRKYVWKISDGLDVDAMKTAAGFFLGEHSFLAFCSNKHLKKSPVRRISRISVEREGPKVILEFTGNGFLYNMVRIMVGTLVEVGLGNLQAGRIPEILASGVRENAGPTAPACGLCLMEVKYW